MIDFKRLSNKQKAVLLQKIEQAAAENERNATGCARVVLHTVVRHLELDSPAVIKAATPLAGGVASTGQFCGALLGGIMAIGLAFAPSTVSQETTKMPGYDKSMELAGVLYDRFQSKFGTSACREIQLSMWGRSWNFRDPDERTEFLKPEYHDRCGEVAGEAARLAAKVIIENAE